MSCDVRPEDSKQLEDAFACMEEHEDLSCVDDIDLEQIDRGTNRLIFGYGDDCVIKLQIPPAPHVAHHSNEREVRAWEDAPGDLKQHLVPIEDYNEEKTWLTMQRVTPHDVREEGHTPFTVEQSIKEDAENNGWRCTDVRSTNLGTDSEDEWVLFDYADCVEFS